MPVGDNTSLAVAPGHRNSWLRRKVDNAFGEQVASTMRDLVDRNGTVISTSHLLKCEQSIIIQRLIYQKIAIAFRQIK